MTREETNGELHPPPVFAGVEAHRESRCLLARARSDNLVHTAEWSSQCNAAWGEELDMLARITSSLVFVLLACSACAAEPPSDSDQAPVDEVSSALPLAAVSMTGANFAGLGVGLTSVGTVGSVGGGTVGTTTSVGGTLGTGPMGTSFNSGPMGFSTGPIGFNSSFGTGPISTTTGGTTTFSSGTGAAPVMNHTCVGFGCP